MEESTLNNSALKGLNELYNTCERFYRKTNHNIIIIQIATCAFMLMTQMDTFYDLLAISAEAGRSEYAVALADLDLQWSQTPYGRFSQSTDHNLFVGIMYLNLFSSRR